MSSSVNKVILVGNLGKDPEVRLTTQGKKIANLSLATKESWIDKQTNAKQEKTDWHKVVIFNENIAEIASKYLKKGDKVYLEGQLQTRKWTDNTGSEHTVTEVVLPKFGGEIVMLTSKSTHHVGGEDFSNGSYVRATQSPNIMNQNQEDEFMWE